jgi:hypothetical protein
MKPLLARGERSSAARVRGRLSEFELYGQTTKAQAVETPPHPNLLPARGEKERAAPSSMSGCLNAVFPLRDRRPHRRILFVRLFWPHAVAWPRREKNRPAMTRRSMRPLGWLLGQKGSDQSHGIYLWYVGWCRTRGAVKICNRRQKLIVGCPELCFKHCDRSRWACRRSKIDQ